LKVDAEPGDQTLGFAPAWLRWGLCSMAALAGLGGGLWFGTRIMGWGLGLFLALLCALAAAALASGALDLAEKLYRRLRGAAKKQTA
jgi:hypothetical protein